jgi:hypothetical protein
MPRVEAAGWEIDVLRLYLELPTVSPPGPRLDGPDEARADALPASLWGHADIPQHREILTFLQHREGVLTESNRSSTDPLSSPLRRKHTPMRKVKTCRPLGGPLSIERAIVLRVGDSDPHGAGLELHHEEDDVADQTPQGQDFDGEKVGRGEAVPMSSEERLPGDFVPRSGAGWIL